MILIKKKPRTLYFYIEVFGLKKKFLEILIKIKQPIKIKKIMKNCLNLNNINESVLNTLINGGAKLYELKYMNFDKYLKKSNLINKLKNLNIVLIQINNMIYTNKLFKKLLSINYYKIKQILYKTLIAHLKRIKIN